MTANQLIKRLQLLPPNTEIWIDRSCDYEEFDLVSQLIPGNGAYGLGGGYFQPDPNGKEILIR